MLKKIYKVFLCGAILLVTGSAALAKGGGEPPKESSLYDPFVVTMVIIMIILLLAIGLLANVVLGAAGYYYKREKENEEEKKKASGTGIIATIALLLFASPLFAQADAAATTTAAVQTAADALGSLSPTAFYFMVGVISVELLVVFVLLYQLRVFIAKEKLKKQNAESTAAQKPRISLWHKINSFRPVEQEADLDLGHDYDGIRELDNRLPPWWLWGFYATILVAVVYFYRFHISHSAPLSAEEFQMEMAQAEQQKAEYLKKSASNVDENTVKLLTGASDLADGGKVFKQNCSPCHGKMAEGVVGPNLTDDYWLHGGSLKDVFKTIKYGWPEKGMRSWKDDLSPVQIAQVASYIKSLHGSNPPNAKPQQGELYKEDGNSTSPETDSVATKAVAATDK
jgi:cytochrome c oxidase cbb3-type subunit 3